MKTVLPQDLTVATDEEVAAAELALVAEFDTLIDEGSTDVVALTEIAEGIEAVRAQLSDRAVAAQEAADKVAALSERVHVAEVEVEVEGEVAPEIAEAGAEEAPVAEETQEIVAEEASVEQEESELVTASADKTPKAPSASAVARRSATPEAPEAGAEIVITAAADVPGFSGGSSLDKLGIAKAMHAKARTLSNGSGYVPVASINLPIEHKLGSDLSYNMDVLDRATAPSALTAAGWCAPSNNLYTLFGIDAGDGLLDLPTVQITRGGLNVPGFIGFDDAVENGGLWTWTEYDQDNEMASKPCVYIPCPSFTDYRLEAEGICVTNGNLTDRAFPELTTRYIQLVVNAHLHRVSAAMINKIGQSSSSIYTMQTIQETSTAGRILSALDMSVADYRSKYRMSVNSVLEVIFPLWVKEILRADFAMRSGVDLTNLSDAQLDAYFAVRKVRPQFVHDYQPFSSFDMYGGPVTQWPYSMNFMIYPAGGFVKGDGGVIDLGVVRDSVLNATNDYTAAWTEQMYLVAQLGPDARQYQITLDTDGHTGIANPS